MNPRNPTDKFFRKRLEHYKEEAPMHLWQDIERQRPWRHRLALRVQRNRPLIATLLFCLVSTLPLLYLWPEEPPLISSFPIPDVDKVPVAARNTATALLPLSNPIKPPKANVSLSDPLEDVNIQSRIQTPVSPLPAPAVKTTAVPIAARTEIAPPATVQTRAASPLPSLLNSVLALPERDPQCVSFGTPHRWRFYADLTVGPELPHRKIEALSPEYESYAQARKDTELPKLSFSAQLRFSTVTEFGLALRSGLSYAQYNERFDFTDNSEEKITITNIYGPKGEIIGTDTIVEKGMIRQVAQNSYQLLDFPILLGYELRRKNWTLAFNGGPVINMLFSARGKFISPEEMSPTTFSSDPNGTYPAFRQNIGVGWYAGIGFHYKIQDDLQLLIEPHFRFNPNSVTRQAYVLTQQYFSSGLSIGLRKQI